MELSPQDYYHKVEELLSMSNIELLVNIWADSVGLGTVGKEIRKMITEAIPQIAQDNRIPSADTFRELVSNYDDVKSLSQKLLVSNGYIVIPRDQKIPYTLERFLHLFPYTGLRGLRIIADNKNGELLADHDFVNTVFAMKKVGEKLRFIFFQSEEYKKGDNFQPDDWSFFDMTRAEKESLYIDTTPEKLEEDFRVAPSWIFFLKDFFRPTYQVEDSGIRFVSKERKNVFLLMEESYKLGQKLILLENLDDNGEYFTTIRDGERDFAYCLISPLSFCFKFLTEGVELFNGGTMQKYGSYFAKDIGEENIGEEETASYLAYHCNDRWDLLKRSYKKLARRFNVYSGFVHFAKLQGIKYACINTGEKILCLVSEKEIPKVKDFVVVDHRLEGSLHFYSIVLR